MSITQIMSFVSQVACLQFRLQMPGFPPQVLLILGERFAENCPTEAALFNEMEGGWLLAMLNKQVAYMTVIRLPANEGACRSGTFEVLYIAD